MQENAKRDKCFHVSAIEGILTFELAPRPGPGLPALTPTPLPGADAAGRDDDAVEAALLELVPLDEPVRRGAAGEHPLLIASH